MRVLGYLDAGSGSMVVGAIAAGAAGAVVAAKVGWRRMAGAFTRKGDALESPAGPGASGAVDEPSEQDES